MMKKQTLMASALLGASVVSCVALAESTASSSTTTAPSEEMMPVESKPAMAPASESAEAKEAMSKTNWLNTIAPMLPGLICKGFMGDTELKMRLDKIKMNYEQCVSVIPESVTKCRSQLAGGMPDKITNEAASIWGKNLGECIGKDFAMKYLIPKQ